MKRLILFLLPLLMSCQSSNSNFIFPYDFRTNSGDNPAWAEPGYQDENWQQHEWFNQGIGTKGNWWVRAKIAISNRSLDTPKGIFIDILGAFELYWDGELIGSSGKVGTDAKTEQPGLRQQIFLIPYHLYQEGEHQIAIRVSSHLGWETVDLYSIYIGDFYDISRYKLVDLVFINIMAGLFFVVFIYYLLIYFLDDKSPRIILFSVLCFFLFALVVAEHSKYYLEFPYHYQPYRITGIWLLNFVIALLLPLFFSFQFSLPYKGGIVLALVPVSLCLLIYMPSQDPRSIPVMMSASIISSLCLIALSVLKKAKGSWLSATGLLILLPSTFINYDITLFLGFSILVICILLSLTLQIREEHLLHQKTIAEANRLKSQLLKRNLQPHFIKNALTSLIDWIEEDPRKGAEFVEAIAEEFELLIQTSESILIPVSKELELCRSYLKIMSFRKEINFYMDDIDVDQNQLIPPALIHTALENGVIHNRFNNSIACFKVRYTQHQNYQEYRIFSSAKPRSKQPQKEGEGSLYIKSRLQESYPNRWRFNSAPSPEGWLTCIQIYASAKLAAQSDKQVRDSASI